MYEERLREVRFDSNHLVVNIVVVGVIAGEPLEGIEWERVPAVVVDSLEGGDYEQKRCLTHRHARQPLGDDSTTRVENETFDRMIVQRTVRIRYIEPVVPRVERLVQECVHMHGTVEEILPCVDDEKSGDKLSEWDCPPVDIVNEVLRFVKPKECCGATAENDIERTKDDGCNGLHSGNM